ncbi:MFS transporter [Lysinibacillus agricola]|uniref:MFS transporter n=1 Tax=Lysinibacillus agricola TaxID=2590012 RepID=A0ABX7ASM8_9BACI|nr:MULTISPECIES: MFS transporter [Lysinibacillus]KOS60041.1 MFS transporter [Lysinibacillus sp. FJAT-14222]QQP11913.1 MFS transporter [Lysinibacillus agricola]
MTYFSDYSKKRFAILVLIVSISGFSQGMLLPLISIIFERDGVSSALNGLNATGLYIGTLLISPFIEQPLRKWGYKPIILIGGALVFASLLIFPLWKSVTFWFVLRLLIGVGDHALHFATQTWITSTTDHKSLGKGMAIYGLSFSTGFAVGPLMVKLIQVTEALPFIVSSAMCLFAWAFVFFLQNEKPERLTRDLHARGWHRYKIAIAFGWIAFLGPFAYGFLESALNALFPVYALRKDFDVNMIPIMLSVFTFGGILTQVPLGAIADKIGRRYVLMIGSFGGAIILGIASFLEHSQMAVAVAFFFTGALVGSMFSLGITYMADLTPKELLPTGNLLCGIALSIGSLTGPFLGGVYLEYVKYSFLLLVAMLLLAVAIVLLVFGRNKNKRLVSM